MFRPLPPASMLLLASLLNLGQSVNGLSQAANVLQPSGRIPDPFQHVGKQSSTPLDDTPRVLQFGPPKPVQVPPFARMTGTKCDSNGNMYFRLAGAKHSESVLEISHDGTRNVVFAPPKPDKPDPLGLAGVRDFFVTPSGRVYDLLQNRNDQGIVVIEFDSDGSVHRTVKLEVPERLNAESLAVFDDGTLLLQGYIHVVPGGDAAKNYLAVFNENGKLRKEFSDFPNLDLASQSKSIQDGGFAVGQDGNAYLLDANFITVFSATGEVARRMPYKKPDPALVAQGLAVSEGLIAMTVLQIKSDDDIIPRFLVVRADDGRRVGYYTLEDESHNPSAFCFSRNEGFTFLKLQMEEQKLTLVNASLQ